MKRTFLAILLAIAAPAFAQFAPPSAGTTTQVWTFKPSAAPAVSDAGWAKMYLDASCGCLKWSYNGGAYANLYTPGLAFVASFNGRTQAVTPQAGDYTAAQVTVSPAVAGQATVQASLANLDGRATTNAEAIASLDTLKAPIADPTFTGIVAIPTLALDGVNISATPVQINYLVGVTGGIQDQINAKAPIASPTFTGTVGGITKTMVGLGNVDNTTDLGKPISTAAQAALDLKANIANPTFTTRITTPAITLGATAITATGAEINHLSGVTSALQTQLNAKAPLASPTFTGVPAAPTAAADTNTTQVATTAYVVGQGYLKSATAASTYAPIANPTFTGVATTPDIRFNGTTTSGLRLKSLTTTQRNALTAVAGDVIWNSSDSRYQVYNGSAWIEMTRRAGDTMTGALAITQSSIGTSPLLTLTGTSGTDRAIAQITAGNGTTSSRYANTRYSTSETSPQAYVAGMFGSTAYVVRNDTAGTTPLSIDASTSLVTLANGFDASTGDARIKGGKFTAGVLTIKNVAGVLQHQIHYRYGSTAASSYVSTITGASGTLANTPTVSGAVGFTAGVGISGSSIIFDTAAQTDGDLFLYPNVELNSTGTVYLVQGSRMSSDIAGVTRIRPSINLRHSTTGAPITIDTTAIPLNAELSIRFFGFIK